MPYDELDKHQKENIDKAYSILWLNSDEEVEMLEDLKNKLKFGTVLINMFTSICIGVMFVAITAGDFTFEQLRKPLSIFIVLSLLSIGAWWSLSTSIDRSIRKKLEILYP